MSLTTAKTVVVLLIKVTGIVKFKVAPAAISAVVTKVPTRLAVPVVGLASYIAIGVPATSGTAPLLVIVAAIVNPGHEPTALVIVMLASAAAVVP